MTKNLILAVSMCCFTLHAFGQPTELTENNAVAEQFTYCATGMRLFRARATTENDFKGLKSLETLYSMGAATLASPGIYRSLESSGWRKFTADHEDAKKQGPQGESGFLTRLFDSCSMLQRRHFDQIKNILDSKNTGSPEK